MSQRTDCKGKNWVVIVAGSWGWFNYRHQAETCHAYQIVHKNGIPDEQIVVMMYDDIAYNERNPTPGIIINRPNGPDVYKGVPKDYTGDAVTPENFMAVLKGDSQGGSRKVLNSGPNDHVFVYFADHGAVGILVFPHAHLHVKDFKDTIKYMHENKKYKEMVIYIEACDSGSMMTDLPGDIDIYATTSANASEPAYACYYDAERRTYLGSVYSNYWMGYSDVFDLTKNTLFQQFEFVKEHTNGSHVQQYGDKTVSHMTLMEFQGNSFAGALPAEPMTLHKVGSDDIIPSRDVPLGILKRTLMASDDMSTMRGLLKEIDAHLKVREMLKETMHRVVERVTGDKLKAQKILNDRMELSQHECYKSAVTHYKHSCFNWNKMEYEHALTHHYALVNLCEGGYSIDSIQKAMDYVMSK